MIINVGYFHIDFFKKDYSKSIYKVFTFMPETMLSYCGRNSNMAFPLKTS